MPDLTEWAKLEKDKVLAGLFEAIVTANDLMPHLKFLSMDGNSLVYNRESTLPTGVTHQVGDTWTDTEPTFTKKTAALTEVGVQSPLDRFILATRGSVQNPEAILRISMAKALARKIEQQVIVGNPGAVSTDMEGILSLLITDSRLMMMDDATTPATITGDETELTLDRLDQMIDLVELGKPSLLLMNKTMRRKLTALSRAAGSGILVSSINDYGEQVDMYQSIKIGICDWLTNAETYENASGWASSTATTILALKFGQENQGFTILHNGPVMKPDWQSIGIKPNKNENLYRMVVYIQGALFSAKVCAGLAGIDSAA